MDKLKKEIRDALTTCAVNGMHLGEVNKEFILVKTDQILELFQQHKKEWLEELIGENEDPDEFYKKHRHRTDMDWTRTEAALHERNLMRDRIREKGGLK